MILNKKKGENRSDPEWFKTGFATSFSFSFSLFFRREEKRERNNQLP